MSCNPMFRALHEMYEDHYGNCNDINVCLVDLLGVEMMLEKCENCGLDKLYPMEYKKIKNKLDGEVVEENES